MPQLLTGIRAQSAAHWLDEAARTGLQSPCMRRRCGSVLVTGTTLIARAFNSPPPGGTHHCNPYPPHLKKGFGSDKTCCTHAEQRLILNALRNQNTRNTVPNSTLYYASIAEDGDWRRPSGHPRCTICSKMALEAGVGAWVLEHENGITQYSAQEYNQISFNYGKE